MSVPSEVNKDRRELFRAFGRGAALMCLAVIGVLAARRPSPDGKGCMDPSFCPPCKDFNCCGLPLAHLARQARRER